MDSKPLYTPMYFQIKEKLLERIMSGEWAPGYFLPSEQALAVEYGCSQGTIRKALNVLTREKLVTRHQGKGTSVTVMDENNSRFRFFLLSDLSGKRVYPVSVCLSVGVQRAGDEAGSALGIGADADVVHIHRIRHLGGAPTINQQIFLPVSRFPGFFDKTEQVPNTLYMTYQKDFGITIARVYDTFKSVLADDSDQKLLKVAPGTPLLEVKRISYDHMGTPVELRLSRINTANHLYQGTFN